MELESDMDVAGGLVITEEFTEEYGITVFIQAGEPDIFDDARWDTAHPDSVEDPLSVSNIEMEGPLDSKVDDSEGKIEIVENEVIAEPSADDPLFIKEEPVEAVKQEPEDEPWTVEGTADMQDPLALALDAREELTCGDAGTSSLDVIKTETLIKEGTFPEMETEMLDIKQEPGMEEPLVIKVDDSDVKIEIVENEVNAEPSAGGGDILRCEHCAYTCLGQNILDGHVRKWHGHFGRSKKYRCDKCAYCTDKSSSMTKHQLTHTGERPFACDKCDKAYTEQGKLAQHIRAVHDRLRPYSCNVCGKAFTLACGLKRHQRIHIGTSVAQCEQCGKQFNRRSSYTRHQRIHSCTNVPQCEECGKQFNNRSQYIVHMKLHDDLRAHKCQMCSARFVARPELSRHMRTHTGERPYACPHCSAAFSQQSSMKNHVIASHTRDYKHRCELCGKGFITPGKLSKHSDKCSV